MCTRPWPVTSFYCFTVAKLHTVADSHLSHFLVTDVFQKNLKAMHANWLRLIYNSVPQIICARITQSLEFFLFPAFRIEF